MTSPAAGPLLVVQPSADYAGRVRRHFPDAVLLATPERAALLREHPRVVEADLDDLEASLSAIRARTRQERFTCGGIVSYICDYLLLTARLARRLGLVFHSEGQVRCTRSKEESTAAWQSAQVPVPPSRRVRALEELVDFASATRPGPWILKPTSRSGSEWVLKVERFEDLPAAHARISAGLAEDLEPASDVVYLVQTFVSGREFSADLYVEEGQAHLLRLTEKYLLPQAGLAGLVGAYYPARADQATLARARDALGQGVRALGIDRGVVMVDAILSGGTFYLLEMALRPGGDCLPDLYRLATGYDPILTAGQVALGGRPALPPLDHPAPVAALHLMGRRSGRILHLDFGRLQAHPAVLEIEPYHLPGECLRCWAGSYDDRILAACLVRCADPAILHSLVEELSDLIDLELEEDHEAGPAREEEA